jgi:two-component system phosphate regulon response regulator OmpR
MKKFEAHILLVDDDDRIRDEKNYLVTTATDAEDAQKKVKIIKFDLIVLDIMMPGQNGLDFTRENKNHLYTPIILLTAKGEPEERIEGLEVGADDYLSKPFEPKELVLRIKNILNKTKSKNIKRLIEFGNVKVDLSKHLILKNKKTILELMINSPGKSFSRDEIGKIIKIDKERSIDVVITRLRKKIEEDPKNPKYLQTLRGEGYVLWIE